MRSTALVVVALPLAILVVIGGGSCTTGVEPSPQPGIVRVTLQADPSDTSIVIVRDTTAVTSEDSMNLTVFQGTISTGDKFAILYRTLTSYRQEDAIYNVLRRENGHYVTYVVFESYAPPTSYISLQVGMTASVLKFHYMAPIPIQPPQDSLRFVTIPVEFEVYENTTTEINLEVSALRALTRYRDYYTVNFPDNMKLLNVRSY